MLFSGRAVGMLRSDRKEIEIHGRLHHEDRDHPDQSGIGHDISQCSISKQFERRTERSFDADSSTDSFNGINFIKHQVPDIAECDGECLVQTQCPIRARAE